MRLVTAFKMVEEDLSPNYQMYLFENMDIVFKIVRAPHSCFNSFLKRYFYSFQINSHYQIAFSDYRIPSQEPTVKKSQSLPIWKGKGSERGPSLYFSSGYNNHYEAHFIKSVPVVLNCYKTCIYRALGFTEAW